VLKDTFLITSSIGFDVPIIGHFLDSGGSARALPNRAESTNVFARVPINAHASGLFRIFADEEEVTSRICHVTFLKRALEGSEVGSPNLNKEHSVHCRMSGREACVEEQR